MSVQVDIEYCGVCDFTKECTDLKKVINDNIPEAKVVCKQGRRGSFEVQINDTLVHSKLSTLAFADHIEVVRNVRNALEGKEVNKVKERPITDCCIQ